ncbi:MAG: CusA/CzcA family heavy metal efflux RND transporter [Sulfurovum sp. 39-42-12]|nr:MAG: CusA/CzcA family heavy metal efflux RND transporter [Sulfurovum sp. 35-42-20]OYZ24911.1 MAG: CusA/CzcA family heavy metal efflux RND transporter [Sulfurovum sp. 16-42-52]OYZ47809.1 MAG: CusA/CzcA family heavy metal efflux RND transporter [Sulfurovum sp. 24-42-9]OZA44874.1 MAG: CusA/CzcA family heavy metal efflux RND transporter [Sulfurovum sp. 17-42-90]OZA61270.1 MAG: CusA/CzcA family heavy metal efflux RND transporter [Sulfurovum sp. 39-42-12]HQS78532.1 CusA/CzcA family heavy metal ef
MKNFFKILIQYKFLILALFIAISGFGYKAYKNIPIDAFPDITPKQVVIYTESVGNSAEDIEKLITYPIEAAMSGLPGVKMILSNSIFGLSYVSIFFEDGYDTYLLRQLVTERLNTVDIPQGWGVPTMGPNTTGLGQVIWYALEDKDNKYTPSQLRQMHEYTVTPLLKSVDGVEEVISWGGFEKQYEVLLDPKRLQAVDVTYNEVIEALEKSNQSVGGQYLEFNMEQYLIRGSGLYKKLDDIRNTVIRTKDAKTVTVKDVATVQEGKAPRFGAVSVDGKERVFGMVLQRSETNAAKVVELIKEKMSLVESALPKGVKLQVIYDRTEITRKAVDTMTSALLTGSVLVAIILFLFLFELRSAFIVIISLPISLLIAFLMMEEYGISANLMSLSGLAIAIGMIVDGTIVVVENSFRILHDNPKASRADVIAEATAEVAKPVLFALLIISAVFIPLLSLEGLAGKLYTPMALDIVFVMLGSLAVALLLVPVLSYMMLKEGKHSNSPLMEAIKAFYTPMLMFSLQNTKKLVTLTFFVFFILAGMLSQQGREFMPQLNEETIMYRVIAIPGTSLTQSVENAQAIENFILTTYPDEVLSVLSMVGRSEKGETAQANYMEVLLTLSPEFEEIPALDKELTKKLKEKFNYLQFISTQPIAMRIEELLEGVSAELAVKIYGEDQTVMSDIAAQIAEVLNGIEGLDHAEVETQLGQSQINIKPDYLALSRYGLSVEDVMQVIRYGIGEEAVTQKIEGVKRFGVVAKLKNAKQDIETLKTLILRSNTGKIVSLQEVCDISVEQGPAFIKRQDLSRYMVLSLEVEGRDIATFVKEADRKIKNQVNLPDGYYIKWAGDFKNMQEATQTLAMIIPATLLLILLLLYTAFNSLKKALLILLGVPLGLMGGIVGLLVSGEYLSVSAIVGFIAIFAIAILNGIILVSFIDELRKKFPEVKMIDMVKNATLLRLRPVLMTAFTTLFGILPLLFATGVGSEIQYPLAVVVTGGIISSTILTLLVLPSLYIQFFEKK